jgi:hypothetical protein
METNILCSLATWQPGMADLSGTNKITLANITIEAEGIGPKVRDALEHPHVPASRQHGSAGIEPARAGILVDRSPQIRLPEPRTAPEFRRGSRKPSAPTAHSEGPRTRQALQRSGSVPEGSDVT